MTPVVTAPPEHMMVPKNSLASCLTVLVAFAMVMFGCAGNRARDGIGVPTVNTFADAIVADANLGIQAMPEGTRDEASAKLSAFQAAAASTDRAVLASEAWPRWAYVRELAEAGITAQEAESLIGPGVASSKRERLSQYERVLRRTANIPP